MKTVAVIGAGPAGLVTAKTLLHSYPPGTFRVSIYEQSSRIGGLWAVESAAEDGLINPEMRANFTQFSISFSDLSWQSINLDIQSNAGRSNETVFNDAHTPIYPKAWQVNRYLQQYFKKFLPPDIVLYHTKVKRTERIVHQDGSAYWKVTSVNSQSKEPIEATSIFDYMIITSGFFSRPRPINCELHGVTPGQDPTRVMHSSHFRKLSDLSIDNKPLRKGKVLVVGGSHSGGDIATSIAFQTSNDRYSPSAELTEGIEPVEVIHVVPQPLYAIPPFIQASSEAHAFVPAEFVLFYLWRRPPGPISFLFGKTSPEIAQGMQIVLQCILDGKKPNFSSQTKDNKTKETFPPYVTINESYGEFVRSGAIAPRVGRLLRLAKQQTQISSVPKFSNLNDSGLLCATVANGSDVTRIEDIAAVVYATGYTASTALDFLPDEVKTLLEFDPSYPRLPLLLETDFLTRTAAVADLAFTGFSDGAAWGIMEMQAHLIAQRWVKPELKGIQKEAAADILSRMRDLRQAMLSDKSAVPQHLFGDFVGFMEQASRELNLERLDMDLGGQQGPVFPARYKFPGTDDTEAQRTMAKLQQVMLGAMYQGAFVARATFRAMQGTWNACPFPNEDPTAIASFHPRRPTHSDFDFEYLYIERHHPGIAAEGPCQEERHLVYRYSEVKDQISVWTTEANNQLTADSLYYILDFKSSSPLSQTESWTAIGHHESAVAKTDLTYTFYFSGVALQKFSIETAKAVNQDTEEKAAIEFVR